MYDSNIRGLSDAINQLHTKINALEVRLARLSIQGGHNARVTHSGDQFVIDFDAKKQGDMCEWLPWNISVEKIKVGDVNKLNIYVSAGLVNEQLADNVDEIVAEEIDEFANRWIYLDIVTNGFAIEEMNVVANEEKPDITSKFTKNAFPTNIIKLIGYVEEGLLKHQFLSKHLVAHPEIAFQDTEYQDASIIDNYYTWVFK